MYLSVYALYRNIEKAAIWLLTSLIDICNKTFFVVKEKTAAFSITHMFPLWHVSRKVSSEREGQVPPLSQKIYDPG